MSRDSRSSSPSYDADPRLPQGMLVIALLLLVLVGGVALIIHGLS